MAVAAAGCPDTKTCAYADAYGGRTDVCANCGTTAAALAELKMPPPHLETAAAVRLAAVVAKAACASDEPPGACAEII